MAAFLHGIADRNSAVRKAYASALGHLVRVGYQKSDIVDSPNFEKVEGLNCFWLVHPSLSQSFTYEPVHAISNNVVCATSKVQISLRIRTV